jgi:hypothetical protein
LGPNPSSRRAIGTLVFVGLFLVLSKLVVPALTDWHIPDFAFWVFVAILFAIPGGWCRGGGASGPMRRSSRSCTKRLARRSRFRVEVSEPAQLAQALVDLLARQ